MHVSTTTPPPVVAVIGSTATGKSDLGIALARELDGEVVNADAMQLYRWMDVGTAKVPPAERHVPHHQLDVLDIAEEARVAAYQTSARADVAAIQARGRRPVVVGGSGLYVRALLDRLEFPGTDPEVRASIEERGRRVGRIGLHQELAAADPVTAARIPRENLRRVVRALEVIELTGMPYSATLPEYEYSVPTVQIGLRAPMADLDAVIEQRVDRMWQAGLVEEVRALEQRGLRDGVTASRAVGYAEVLALLAGELPDEDAARAAVVAHTRRLARRQVKWFRRDPRVHWLDVVPGASTDALDQALAAVAAADPAVG